MSFHTISCALRALILTAVALAAFAPTAAAATRLEAPSAAEIAEAEGLSESMLSAAEAREVEAQAVWGGRYTASTGEAVTIYFSDSYAVDQARAQQWANFIASLVHGAELATVTTYIAPLAEVQQRCGERALACYGRGVIVNPGADPDARTSAESILVHEYGHHIAASRSNPPWAAIAYGTKRWASYEQICAGEREGRYSPGAQDARYDLNPGEGFAEAYRVLNERTLGTGESAWEIVSRDFYPTSLALARLRQDVVDPWVAPRRSKLTRTLTHSAPRRVHRIATPHDGALRIGVAATGAGRVRVEIRDAAGMRITRYALSRSARMTDVTVCGGRTYTVRVTRLSATPKYALTVAKA
jgi:hypothetical protein